MRAGRRDEHGYAVVKEAAKPAELEQARQLLWDWLEATHYTRDGRPTHGWDRDDPSTWSDISYGEGQFLGGELQRNNAVRCTLLHSRAPALLHRSARDR